MNIFLAMGFAALGAALQAIHQRGMRRAYQAGRNAARTGGIRAVPAPGYAQARPFTPEQARMDQKQEAVRQIALAAKACGRAAGRIQ